jgi:uncharacterized protein (TIGR01777 family)
VTTERFVLESEMPASAAEVFAWHERPGAFERLNPPWDPVKIVQRDPSLDVGARTVIEMRMGPMPIRWVAEHTAYEQGVFFRDEQRDGPFARWVHTHHFVPADGDRSTMIDEIEYAPPLGAVGSFFGAGSIRARLARVFAHRHALLRADLLRHRAFAAEPRRTIAITGASGMLGGALSAFLSTGGHTVRAVKRGDFATLEDADAIVHLAGSAIGARWTATRRREMVESRVGYTRALVDALARLDRGPGVLLGGSAVGIYGDRGDEVLDETSAVGEPGERGAAMLAGLCRAWEAESLRAEELGVRVALLRTGVVLDPSGGALAQLLGPFKAGVGGPAGPGTQWMSWIGLEDTIGALHHAAMSGIEGPMNLTAPEPVTNAELARTLGRVLSRPSFVRTPAAILRAMFGEMAVGTILASQRALPGVLAARGFQFLHPQLEPALRFCLGR